MDDAQSDKATDVQIDAEGDDTHTEAEESNTAASSVEPKPTDTKANTTLQTWTDGALNFFSTASNETLGACIAALGATSYLVLGRVGLVLIGIVGGVALHANWEETAALGADEDAKAKETKRRREVGLDIAARVLNWKDKKISKTQDDESEDVTVSELMAASDKQIDYSSFPPATRAALTTLTDAVIRDYVNWWYKPILPKDNSFPLACRRVLTSFILAISSHLSKKRPADTFLDFTTNSSSIMIVLFNEFATAVTASPNSSPHDAIANYLTFKPDSNLANIVDVSHQEKKLRMVADDMLQNFLDPKAYNCEPVRVFLKEVLAGLILEMTLEKCSKPEWINEWIVYLLEGGEPELLHAIDAGVGNATNDAKRAPDVQQLPQVKEILGQEPVHPKPSATEIGEGQVKSGDPMEEAMREAKRLSLLMAEEDARREREQRAASTGNDDATSGNTSQAMLTPTSSSSELERGVETQDLEESAPDVPHDQTVNDSQKPSSTFTSFDQLGPEQASIAPRSVSGTQQAAEVPPLTLHNANISIFDDAGPGDKAAMRSKPVGDYLIQIEPASADHRGWMIARKYGDFETLHEVLRRISVIAGVSQFSNQYAALPSWKDNTKSSLRADLETYLRNALRYAQLAESEGMRRFLEKDQGLGNSPGGGNKGGFPGLGWPNPAAFETMGKGMLDVLTAAPKGAAEGGKAFFGDVGRVFSGVAKKTGSGSNNPYSVGRTSTTSLSGRESFQTTSTARKARESQESFRDVSPILPKRLPATLDRKPVDKQGISAEQDRSLQPRNSAESKRSFDDRQSVDETRPAQSMDASRSSLVGELEEELHLPPPPSEIPDDYASPVSSPHVAPRQFTAGDRRPSASGSIASTVASIAPKINPQPFSSESQPTASRPAPSQRAATPLTEQETQVAVELLFAVINELYTLSSAWNIRRTLLNAAKTFLLRPGNPNLEAIRVLIQESIIDANTSDEGIAAHTLKIRENALPTEEELKLWPPPKSEDEKEKLRVKARKLLVEQGMPQALMSVMGSAATGEALGKVFDVLQIEKVARGMMFGVLLQGIRAVAQ